MIGKGFLSLFSTLAIENSSCSLDRYRLCRVFIAVSGFTSEVPIFAFWNGVSLTEKLRPR